LVDYDLFSNRQSTTEIPLPSLLITDSFPFQGHDDVRTVSLLLPRSKNGHVNASFVQDVCCVGRMMISLAINSV
jgi:hypothetical protein